MRVLTILSLVLFLFTTALAGGMGKISVHVMVPDTSWTIQIQEVYKVENELWVVSSLSQKPDMMGAQVISTVTSSVEIAVDDLPVKYFVEGKTWNWENDEPYTFIKSRDQISAELKSGDLLYKKSD